jgi:hypothetical protein
VGDEAQHARRCYFAVFQRWQTRPECVGPFQQAKVDGLRQAERNNRLRYRSQVVPSMIVHRVERVRVHDARVPYVMSPTSGRTNRETRNGARSDPLVNNHFRKQRINLVHDDRPCG